MGALTEDALRGRARPQTHSHGPFHRPAFDVAPSWRLRSPRSKRKLERTPHDVRHSLFVPCSQKGRPSRCILLVGSESVSPAHRPGDTTAQLVGTRRWGSLEAAVEAADHVPEEALRFPLSCFTFRFQLQFTLGSICTSFRCPAKKPENHVLHRVPPHHRHCIFKRPPGPGTVVPDDMQTADRHMERRSAPLITREVQMKTSRDAASSQPEGPSPTNPQTSAGGTWRRGNTRLPPVGLQTGAAAVENSVEGPQKIKIDLPCDLEIPLLDTSPKKAKTLIQKNICCGSHPSAQEKSSG